jgi:hypothetical protein
VREFIRRRERVERVAYSRFFERADSPGSGFAFDCDAQGTIDVAALNPVAQHSYADAVAGAAVGEYIDRGVQEHCWSYFEPAVLRCDCGAEVPLPDAMTNGCAKCGREYNSSGQLLVTRNGGYHCCVTCDYPLFHSNNDVGQDPDCPRCAARAD